MIIDRITYQKIFPTGMAYLNHKIGVEIQLALDDSPDEAFHFAKETVEQWNKESNPSMGLAMDYSTTPPIDYSAKEKTEIAIDSCTSLSELNLLNADALKYGLIEQFVDTIKSFQ